MDTVKSDGELLQRLWKENPDLANQIGNTGSYIIALEDLIKWVREDSFTLSSYMEKISGSLAYQNAGAEHVFPALALIESVGKLYGAVKVIHRDSIDPVGHTARERIKGAAASVIHDLIALLYEFRINPDEVLVIDLRRTIGGHHE